eukprot:XP_016657572.1 PREDICTED: uncharacterized protein LOC107882932 [Acyrthosiphon pisum]
MLLRTLINMNNFWNRTCTNAGQVDHNLTTHNVEPESGCVSLKRYQRQQTLSLDLPPDAATSKASANRKFRDGLLKSLGTPFPKLMTRYNSRCRLISYLELLPLGPLLIENFRLDT